MDSNQQTTSETDSNQQTTSETDLNQQTTAETGSNQQPASTLPVDHSLGVLVQQEGEKPLKISQEVSKTTSDDSADTQEAGATGGGSGRDPAMLAIHKQFADLSFKSSEAANDIEYREYNRHNMVLLKSLLDRSFQISKDIEKLYADIDAVMADENNSDSDSAQGNYIVPQPFSCLKSQPIPVMLLYKLLPPSRSVGIVFVKVESDSREKNVTHCGTCFRLGTKYVLTCKHVLDNIDEMLKTLKEAEIPANVYVWFNFCEPFKPSLESQIKQNLFWIPSVMACGDNNLDYCVLEMSIANGQIDKVQEQTPGLGHLVCDVEQSGTITLIGHQDANPSVMDPNCPYPHPDVGVYLKLSPYLKGDFSQLIDPTRVTLSSVMGRGSSGSPGFDKDGNLVVMYNWGYFVGDQHIEQAVKMTAIRDHVRKKYPALSEELFP